MLCIDTNILIRSLTFDDPIQSPKAIAFLKKAVAGKEEIYIPDAVILETGWALRKRYGYSSQQAASYLETLVINPRYSFDHPDRLISALTLFANNPISLLDAYLAATTAETPGAQLVTFDRALQKLATAIVEP